MRLHIRMWSAAAVVIVILGAACKSEAPAPAPAAPPPSRPVVAPPKPPAPAAPSLADAAAPADAARGVAQGARRVEVNVTEKGWEPNRIAARTGEPLLLVITRKTDKTCAREILFQGQEGKTDLPLDKTVEVTYTPKASGNIKFGCAMGMMVSGVIAVE